MLSASAEFRELAASGKLVPRADVTLADGSALALVGDDFLLGGVTASSATSSAAAFDIGAAVIGRCSLTLRNEDRRLDSYDLSGASFVLYVGAVLSGGTTEWLRRGTYRVQPADSYDGDVATISGYDHMSLLERPFSEVLGIPWDESGVRADALVAAVCSHCGVALATRTFPNGSLVLCGRPDDGATCLEVVAWAAQATGNFADMDPMGRLRIRWYDSMAWVAEDDLDGGDLDGNSNPNVDGDDAAEGGPFEGSRHAELTAVRQVTVNLADVEVTGLAVTASDEEPSDGTLGEQGETVLRAVGSGDADGYVLFVRDNPLVGYGHASEVAGLVAASVGAPRFRPLSVTAPWDPTIEAGDAIQVTDRLGRTYRTWATQVTWSSSGSVRVACGAKASSSMEWPTRRSRQERRVEQVAQKAEQQAGTITSQVAGAVTNSPTIQAAQALAASMGTGDLSTLAVSYPAFSEISSGLGSVSSGMTSLDGRVSWLENSTSVGEWIIQVNGVPQTTGTINFVTE